jgi:hypothetical protein
VLEGEVKQEQGQDQDREQDQDQERDQDRDQEQDQEQNPVQAALCSLCPYALRSAFLCSSGASQIQVQVQEEGRVQVQALKS